MNDHLDWLPLASQKAIRAEEAREYRAAKDAELDLEQRTEAKRSAAIALYAEQAAERGEHVSAMALATGIGVGRTTAEVLAAAAAAADIQDARAEAKARREDDGPLNFCFDSPPAQRAETAEGREIKNMIRHFADQHPDSDVIDRAIVASEARKAQRRNRPVI